MGKETHDVVIVGAGIVGAACAVAFAERGLRVAIVDRDVVGSGATAAGMGHIVVMDDSPAQFALTRFSQQLWSELGKQLPGLSTEIWAGVRRPLSLPSTQIAAPAGSLLAEKLAATGANCTLTDDLPPEATSIARVSVTYPALLMARV